MPTYVQSPKKIDVRIINIYEQLAWHMASHQPTIKLTQLAFYNDQDRIRILPIVAPKHFMLKRKIRVCAQEVFNNKNLLI